MANDPSPLDLAMVRGTSNLLVTLEYPGAVLASGVPLHSCRLEMPRNASSHHRQVLHVMTHSLTMTPSRHKSVVVTGLPVSGCVHAFTIPRECVLLEQTITTSRVRRTIVGRVSPSRLSGLPAQRPTAVVGTGGIP